MINSEVIIIGAGAAGLMAAGTLTNKSVTVIERNEKPGKKLYISGKGRCNITNDCSTEEFLTKIAVNSRFMHSSISGFTPADTITMLNGYKVSTKTERGKRVFPVSEKASDVIKALYTRALNNKTSFYFNERVTNVIFNNGFTVKTETGDYNAKYLIIATGGKSYPLTGSTGDGYTFGKQLGHTVVAPVPSLVPFNVLQNVEPLSGLTLKNVGVTVKAGDKEFYEFGELLFTHGGVSGPTVLTLSAYVNKFAPPFKMSIDLKPALDFNTLYKRLTSDFSLNTNKALKNSLNGLIPKAIVPYIIQNSGVNGDKPVNSVTKEEKASICNCIKSFELDITSLCSFDTAVVTSGGINVKEVNPKTMESKIVSGLYFAGEVLDIDALTGGFNIQIALSTAYAAAKAINSL